MAAPSFKITFDLGSKLDLLHAVTREVFPLMHQAVRGVAAQTSVNWQTAVLKQRGIWAQEKDDYAASISWRMEGDFTAVVEASYRYAADIETGRPPRDLKRMLDTSQKVRRTTDGRRFLVIPLRHNTPGNSAHAPAMPSAVYDLAQAMEESAVTQTGERSVGQTVHLSPHRGMTPAKTSPFLSSIATKQHAMTAARLYAWGGRLTKGAMKQAGMDAATRKRYAGMVKMDTSTPGGSKSSAYLTFRVMIEGSNGWIVPAQPGRWIAKQVAEDMAPKAEAAFQAAIKHTVK